MTNLGRYGAVVAAALGLGACEATYTITDDIDLSWDFVAVPTRFDADLHTPYVLGTKVTLFAHSSDDQNDFRGWTIGTSDPAVFRIDDAVASSDGRSLAVHGQAVAEGSAQLRLLDRGGREVGHGVAEVLAPDRIELAAHGSLILDREDEAPVSEVRVVANGTATYLVRYFRGERQLHGNGVLTAQGAAAVTVERRTTFLFENREWLVVRATGAGTSVVQLGATGAAVRAVPVVVVPETAIAAVVVLTQSEVGRHDGDWMVALAQAYDGGGSRIFGVECTWKVNGVGQPGDGDLYRYRYRNGSTQSVQAKRGAHEATVMIHSDGGYVSSSNTVGCGAGGGGSLGAGLVGVGLVIAARRRQRGRAPIG
jgi:hypothetical protein